MTAPRYRPRYSARYGLRYSGRYSDTYTGRYKYRYTARYGFPQSLWRRLTASTPPLRTNRHRARARRDQRSGGAPVAARIPRRLMGACRSLARGTSLTSRGCTCTCGSG